MAATERELFELDVCPEGAPDEVGDPVDVTARQFVNRWVFLSHQRPLALAELRDLIAKAKARA